MTETTSAPVLLTVAQFCERHSWAKVGGIRSAIFFRASNGFETCILRFGRKVLLDEAAVIAWLRGRGGSNTPIKVSA